MKRPKKRAVMAYQVGVSKDMEEYRKVFSKAYPGIEVQDFFGTGEQILAS